MNTNQAARLDKHAIQAHLILAKTSVDGEVEVNKNYVLGYTSVDLPTYNFFIPLALTGLTDDTLADASAFFYSRNSSYAVGVAEHRVPDGTEYLSKRRYQPLPPQPIMTTDKLPQTLTTHQDLNIQEVITVPGMTALYTVIEAVYDYTPDQVTQLFPTSQVADQTIRHFVGFIADGTPVTAGTAIYAENVVSIWNLATQDDFRRRGFATALMNHILVDATQQGCDLSLIYATAMGYSLFNNLGYKLYAMYQWFLP